jgi:hypothetical protein
VRLIWEDDQAPMGAAFQHDGQITSRAQNRVKRENAMIAIGPQCGSSPKSGSGRLAVVQASRPRVADAPGFARARAFFGRRAVPGYRADLAGCLSVPCVFETVRRAGWVNVHALGGEGKQFKLRAANVP